MSLHSEILNNVQAVADFWPDPDPRLLNGGVQEAPAFPTELFGSMGRYISDLAASKGSPPDYMAAAVLTAAAACIGGSRSVVIRRNWVEPCALWTVSVGNPSAGKSQPLDAVKRPLLAIERSMAANFDEVKRDFETKKKVAELAREAWEVSAKNSYKASGDAPLMPADALVPDEPTKPRLVIGNTTTEAATRLFATNPRGLVMIEDELSRWLGDFNKYGGGGEAAFYLSTFNGLFTPTDRVKAGHLSAYSALLSIAGGIQPERLHEQLFAGRSNDGLICRFLPFWPDPVAPKWSVPEVYDDGLKDVLDRLSGLRMAVNEEGRPAAVLIPLSPDAVAIYSEWWTENSQAAIDLKSGLMAEFRGKAKGTVGRLALVLELLEWAACGESDQPQEISAHAVAAAANLFETYFIPMAARVYGDASRPTAERLAVSLLAAITKRGATTFNSRDVQRSWKIPGLSHAEPIRQAVAVLIEADCIQRVEQEKQAGGGRPREDFIVNPKVQGGGHG